MQLTFIPSDQVDPNTKYQKPIACIHEYKMAECNHKRF